MALRPSFPHIIPEHTWTPCCPWLHLSNKDAVWRVDAQPLSPSPSRRRNARRSSPGSEQRSSLLGVETCPDDLTPRRGAIDHRHCRDGRDQPALCLQMGAAISGAGRRGVGGQTWPWARAAPGSPAGAARHGRGITPSRRMLPVKAEVVLSRRGWPTP